MNLIVRNTTIFDATSAYHLQQKDIYIKDGIIDTIGDKIPAIKDVEELEVQYTSQGWFDLFCFCGEPGLEHLEDYNSLRKAAVNGGFTKIAILPNTKPVVDNKAGIQYVLNNNSGAITLLPYGSVTDGIKGKTITEMMDMNKNGAIGFTDASKPLYSSELVVKALQYVKPFNGVIVQQSGFNNLVPNGMVHEGLTSTQMGIPGIPGFSEALMIHRDLAVLRYTDSQMHFVNVSTKESIDLIRAAKTEGLKVTCSVNPLNLIYNDTQMSDYDSNLKVLPPLRSESDRKALIEAVNDGTIDAICSNHHPLDTESNDLEFFYAEFGAAMIEHLYLACNTHLSEQISREILIEKITNGARKCLHLATETIKEGVKANFTFFNDKNDDRKSFSKGVNSPFGRSILKGNVQGVFANGELVLN